MNRCRVVGDGLACALFPGLRHGDTILTSVGSDSNAPSDITSADSLALRKSIVARNALFSLRSI